MSLASKITFTLCTASSLGIIYYVHWKQQYDRDKMREGVIRDIEQQQMKKTQNLYFIEQQKTFTSKYKETAG